MVEPTQDVNLLEYVLPEKQESGKVLTFCADGTIDGKRFWL